MLFQRAKGRTRFQKYSHIVVAYGADDLLDDYHGCPIDDFQLTLCVVAIRSPDTGGMVFSISYAHLSGLTAAVVNFNRLPEFLTAVVRCVGVAPSWRFFDDQGTLDSEGRCPGSRGAQGRSHGMKPQKRSGSCMISSDALVKELSIKPLLQSRYTWSCLMASGPFAKAEAPSGPNQVNWTSSSRHS